MFGKIAFTTCFRAARRSAPKAANSNCTLTPLATKPACRNRFTLTCVLLLVFSTNSRPRHLREMRHSIPCLRICMQRPKNTRNTAGFHHPALCNNAKLQKEPLLTDTELSLVFPTNSHPRHLREIWHSMPCVRICPQRRKPPEIQLHFSIQLSAAMRTENGCRLHGGIELSLVFSTNSSPRHLREIWHSIPCVHI